MTHQIIFTDNVDSLQKLLDSGVDVNSIQAKNQTLLQLSIMNSAVQCFDLLMAQDNIDVNVHAGEPLTRSIEKFEKHPQFYRTLYRHPDIRPEFALHATVKSKNTYNFQLFQELLMHPKFGIKYLQVDKFIGTYLIKLGRSDMVKMLLDLLPAEDQVLDAIREAVAQFVNQNPIAGRVPVPDASHKPTELDMDINGNPIQVDCDAHGEVKEELPVVQGNDLKGNELTVAQGNELKENTAQNDAEVKEELKLVVALDQDMRVLAVRYVDINAQIEDIDADAIVDADSDNEAVPQQNFPTQKSMRNSLVEAVRSNKADILQVLLDYGNDPNTPDNLGCYPLISAVMRGHQKIIKILLKAGANPNIRGNETRHLLMSMTPLLLSVARYMNTNRVYNINTHVKIADALITAGADVNMPFDYHGANAPCKERGDFLHDKTPIDLAIMLCLPEMIDVLLKHKARFDANNLLSLLDIESMIRLVNSFDMMYEIEFAVEPILMKFDQCQINPFWIQYQERQISIFNTIVKQLIHNNMPTTYAIFEWLLAKIEQLDLETRSTIFDFKSPTTVLETVIQHHDWNMYQKLIPYFNQGLKFDVTNINIDIDNMQAVNGLKILMHLIQSGFKLTNKHRKLFIDIHRIFDKPNMVPAIRDQAMIIRNAFEFDTETISSFLNTAIEEGIVSLVHYLLEKGLVIKDTTSLLMACVNRNFGLPKYPINKYQKIIDALIKAGANLNEVYQPDKMMTDDVLYKYVLDSKISKSFYCGRHVIDVAISVGSPEMVKFLLQRGAVLEPSCLFALLEIPKQAAENQALVQMFAIFDQYQIDPIWLSFSQYRIPILVALIKETADYRARYLRIIDWVLRKVDNMDLPAKQHMFYECSQYTKSKSNILDIVVRTNNWDLFRRLAIYFNQGIYFNVNDLPVNDINIVNHPESIQLLEDLVKRGLVLNRQTHQKLFQALQAVVNKKSKKKNKKQSKQRYLQLLQKFV